MYSGISNSFVQVLTLALILVHQLWNADALLLLFVTHRCLLVIFVVLISVDLVLDSPKTLARFPVRFSLDSPNSSLLDPLPLDSSRVRVPLPNSNFTNLHTRFTN